LRRGAPIGAAALTLGWLGGCEIDSYLDPSVTGRWEHTPTMVPILDRIAIIENETRRAEEIEYSDVEPDDLIPDAAAYELGVGDVMNITIRGLYQLDVPELFQRVVDERGQIDIPQFGNITVNGLLADQVRDLIRVTVRPTIADADVSVVVISRQSQTFTILGLGRFIVGKPDLRLLEATGLQGVNQRAEWAYIIRQAPLYEPTIQRGRPPRDSDFDSDAPTRDGADGEEFLRQLDGLTGSAPIINPSAWAMQPGEVRPRSGSERLELQPSNEPDRRPVIDLDGDMQTPTREQRQPAQDSQRPVIGLDGEPTPASSQTQDTGVRWRRINGQWVKVPREQVIPQPTNGTRAPGQDDRSSLVTQRVIRVPFQKVQRGDARYNIVIRPGDVIRIPFQEAEVVYISGQVNAAGPISLQPGLTLEDALESAARGLGPLAIPERIDLTRRIGDDRQATIRLNYRAIREKTQPNIFLKANDHISVGTSALAAPLAVIRSGFRASYGFGFLLDRNFGNDVFGAPPTNQQN